MSKRNITYTKPEEPDFLKRIKQQVGYKEGPTVDTKREELGPAEDLDCDDELPTVVVLNEGDLTAEEARGEQDRLEREAEEAPADLSSRIIFKAPPKRKAEDEPAQPSADPDKKAKKPKTQTKKAVLSFADEEEEDDD